MRIFILVTGFLLAYNMNTLAAEATSFDEAKKAIRTWQQLGTQRAETDHTVFKKALRTIKAIPQESLSQGQISELTESLNTPSENFNDAGCEETACLCVTTTGCCLIKPIHPLSIMLALRTAASLWKASNTLEKIETNEANLLNPIRQHKVKTD